MKNTDKNGLCMTTIQQTKNSRKQSNITAFSLPGTTEKFFRRYKCTTLCLWFQLLKVDQS